MRAAQLHGAVEALRLSGEVRILVALGTGLGQVVGQPPRSVAVGGGLLLPLLERNLLGGSKLDCLLAQPRGLPLCSSVPNGAAGCCCDMLLQVLPLGVRVCNVGREAAEPVLQLQAIRLSCVAALQLGNIVLRHAALRTLPLAAEVCGELADN